MFMLSEVAGKRDKEMPFAINEFWYDNKHIYVSVVAIRFEAIAPEYFESVSKLLEVEVRVFGDVGNVFHPLIDCRSQLSDYPFFDIRGLLAIVVIFGENAIENDEVLLVHLCISLCTDNLMWIFELLKILVRRETV
jgi:hypothetical protein